MNRTIVRRGALVAAAVLVVTTLGIGVTVTLGVPASRTLTGVVGDGAPGAITTTALAALAVRILPAGEAAINPTTPIVVQSAAGMVRSVTVANVVTGTTVHGALSHDRTTWTSTEPLGYGSSYRIDATAIMTDGVTAHRTKTLTTLSPAAQAYPSLIPSPDQSDVGVGQPIVVRFDKAVTHRAAAERALQVTASPRQPGSWYWMSSKEVHYRPRSY
ncbi:MAG: Ig-like domain-containing protein [Pseudonocardiaceae bacterium]